MPESPDDTSSQTGFDIYERPATAEEDAWADEHIKKYRRELQLSGWIVLAMLVPCLPVSFFIMFSRGSAGLDMVSFVVLILLVVVLAVFLVWGTNGKRIQRAIPSCNFMMIVRLKVEEALWVDLDGMIIRCAGEKGLVMMRRRGDLRSAEVGLTKRFPGEEIQLEYYFLRRPISKKLSSSRRGRRQIELVRNEESGYLRAIRTFGQGPTISINELSMPHSFLGLDVDPAVPLVHGREDLYVYEPHKKRAVTRKWVLRDLRVSLSDVRDIDMGPAS